MTTATKPAADTPSATAQFDWIRAELKAEYAPDIIEAAITRFQQRPPQHSMTRPAFLNAIRYHCKNLTAKKPTPTKLPVPDPKKPAGPEPVTASPVPDDRALAESAADFEKPRRLSWHGEVTAAGLREKARALVARTAASPKAGYETFCSTGQRLAALNGGELPIGKLPAADRYEREERP